MVRSGQLRHMFLCDSNFIETLHVFKLSSWDKWLLKTEVKKTKVKIVAHLSLLLPISLVRQNWGDPAVICEGMVISSEMLST